MTYRDGSGWRRLGRLLLFIPGALLVAMLGLGLVAEGGVVGLGAIALLLLVWLNRPGRSARAAHGAGRADHVDDPGYTGGPVDSGHHRVHHHDGHHHGGHHYGGHDHGGHDHGGHDHGGHDGGGDDGGD